MSRGNTLWFYLCIILSIAIVTQSQYPDCVYTAFIKTRYRFGQPIISNVSLTLYDAKGYGFLIPNIALWGGIPGYLDYFRYGSLDTFSGRAPCLTAPVCKMNLTSLTYGNSRFYDWSVEYVAVTTISALKSCSYQNFTVGKTLANIWPPYTLSAIVDLCDNTYSRDMDRHGSRLVEVIGAGFDRHMMNGSDSPSVYAV